MPSLCHLPFLLVWSNDLVTYKNRPIPWNATFLMPSSPQSPLLLPEMQPFSQCLFLCNLQSRLLCANLLHRAVKIFWGLALIFHLIIVVSAKGQCCNKFIFLIIKNIMYMTLFFNLAVSFVPTRASKIATPDFFLKIIQFVIIDISNHYDYCVIESRAIKRILVSIGALNS